MVWRHVTFALLIILVGAAIALKPAWAVTIVPNTPKADQPFSITFIVRDTLGGNLFIYSGSNCSGTAISETHEGVQGSYTLTLTLGPGQYSAIGSSDPSGCVNFTIVPQPEYPIGPVLLGILTVISYALIKRNVR